VSQGVESSFQVEAARVEVVQGGGHQRAQQHRSFPLEVSIDQWR
jgi:hypothetical protein